MPRFIRSSAGMIGLLCSILLLPGMLRAGTIHFDFTATTGTATNMTGATQLVAANVDDNNGAVTNIGFTFTFDGSSYTQFSATSNGVMSLGSSAATHVYNNNFSTSLTPYPVIAPFFDDLVTKDNGVRYLMTGTSPNRVLIVETVGTDYAEWQAHGSQVSTGTYSSVDFQVRLYETSNNIEIYFDSSRNGSAFTATIGMAGSTSNFGSLTSTSTPSLSYTTSTNNLQPPASGTLYIFTPCTTPTISTQPTPQSTCSGSPVSFNVSASGSNLVYQWLKGGTNIVGATSATYTINSPQVSDNGNYSVIVADGSVSGGCTVTSSAVALTVTQGALLSLTMSPTVLWPVGSTSTLVTSVPTINSGCFTPTEALQTVTANETMGGGDYTGLTNTTFDLVSTHTSTTGGRVYTVPYLLTDGTNSTTYAKAVVVPRSLGTAYPVSGGTNVPTGFSQTALEPLSGSATLSWTFPLAASGVYIHIYNDKGKEIRTLVTNASYTAGPKTATWDLKDRGGNSVHGGFYCQIVTSTGHSSPLSLLVQ